MLSETFSPLLRTKLIPPVVQPGLVTRTALQSTLKNALQHPLTLIVAPAGSGKTTLLAQWIQENRQTPAWVSLDEEENDPALFWRYFNAALQKTIPEIPLQASSVLPQRVPGTLPGNLDELCNLLADVPHPVFFCLDHLHRIDNPDIFKSLDYVIEHQPPNFHLILLSRSDPPLPISRLRAKNTLAEIRETAFKFSAAEALAFFSINAETPISQQQAEQIVQATQGWAAGIRLLAVSQTSPSGPLAQFSSGQKAVREYLTDEVFTQLPAHWLAYLEAISVPERVNAELGKALSEVMGNAKEDSSLTNTDLLPQIEQANLFISRVDHPGEWFQFHPFFRDALRQRLPSSQMAVLNRRAAAWFDQHGEIELAISHALAGSDWSTAARLIRQQAGVKFKQGEFHSLESWIRAIPEEEALKEPDLLILLGWVAYMLGQVPETIRLAALVQQSAAHPYAPAQQALLDGLLCQIAAVQEQNRQTIDLAKIAIPELEENWPYFYGVTLVTLANAYQAVGESAKAVTTFKQAVKINQKSGDSWLTTFALVNLGIELRDQGQRRRAVDICLEALDNDATPQNSRSPVLGMIDILLASLFIEADQLEEAAKWLKQGKELLERLRIPGFLLSAWQIEAQLLAAQGRYSEALQRLNQARRQSSQAEYVGFRQLFDGMRADIQLKQGKLATVANWLEDAGLPAAPQDDPAREFEFLVKGKYLLETGQFAEANALFDQLERLARTTNHQRLLISILLTRAVAAWKQNQVAQLEQSVQEALQIAVPEDYLRAILEDGQPILQFIAASPTAPPRLRALAQPAESQATQHPVSTLPEPLTQREIDVLRRLAENDTNPEIAQKLFISSETVKIHLKHIFQKLAVSNRRAAVQQARLLHLID